MLNKIIVRGARANNLKDVDIDIPHNKLVVFTGLSGSGKSSLAFDTIYAEGQRRFMESLSSFTKQFMENLDKPDVDHIDGLPPTIAIDQRTSTASPRSTVGTSTEIYDYLRLLFSRIGIPHCPKCGVKITAYTKQQIINEITALVKKHRSETIFYAPLIKNEKIEVDRIVDELHKLGYHAVRLDGVITTLRELAQMPIDLNKKHTLDIVIDRVSKSGLERYDQTQLVEAVKQALEYGDGMLVLSFPEKKEEHTFTENLICFTCGITLQEVEPRNFSFNNPVGACSSCTGLGYLLKFDQELLIPNKKLTIAQGAIQPLNKMYTNTNQYVSVIEKAIEKHGFTINTPIQDLTETQVQFLLNGDEKTTKNAKDDEEIFIGVIPYLDGKYRETDSEYVQRELEDYMRVFQCHICKGKRLKPEILAVSVVNYTIDQVVSLSITKLLGFFSALDSEKTKKLQLTPQEQKIAKPIIREATRRTQALIDVGLGYLILDRSMATLSGGEAQRVKLANHISSSLVGVVYVLDEPSIGLHQKDTEQLIDTLKNLRDNGNTVIVVEHDKGIILTADMVVDVGPRAGKNGGQIVAQGTPQEVMKAKNSLTGKYLSGELEVTGPKKPHKGTGANIAIIGAEEFNLKNIDVSIPLGKLVVVTGLSGSGKSTLIIEILSKALTKKFYRTKDEPGKHKEIKGLEHIDKVVVIDQSAIGRTPRSNPATYTNIFTPIRELYTELPEAKIKGFKAGHFSFNVKGGRCETCQGEGMMRIDMRFLSDVYVECRDCHGKRYNKEALDVHYEGMSIADILNMTVDEALAFFNKHAVIH
ncbi:MAG: excinuclease ABC subunit UvrA, partial [bacterium]|nr:excinuclease ABC subunit UvrA [bacterium]